MVSTPTTSLRLDKQALGDNLNTWGTHVNTDMDLIDAAIAGYTSLVVSGNVTLTSSNYVTDQARSAALQFTGTGGYTVTIPNVSKIYTVTNSASAAVTVSNGTASVSIAAGETSQIVTDGASNFAKVSSLSWNGNVNANGYTLNTLANPTNNQDAATKYYVDNTAFTVVSGYLPGQTGNSGKYVSTDGTTASWQRLGIYGINSQTSAYTVIASDTLKMISCTGTFTLSLTSAATLTTLHSCWIKNAGTGNITITPLSGAIDGLSSYIIYPGEVRQLFNDGTNFQTIVLNPFYKAWTTTDAGFVWPPGYQLIEYLGWGAGGGGQAGTASAYGAGGGGGGCFPGVISSALYTAGATATITIASGGSGGATSGANGSAGGNSTIGSIVTFYGGLGATAGVGGRGGSFASGSSNTDTGFGGANGGVSGGLVGSASTYGGAGGGGGTSGAYAGGASVYGGGGGGTGQGGSGGASTFGGAGGAGTTTSIGGNGTAPGGGGAGGGTTGGTFQAGGAGARGEVRMWGVI